MTRLDERIAAHEKKLREEQELLRSLRNERRKREVAERREAERLAREAEQREAVAFWRLLHDNDVRLKTGIMNAYEYVCANIVTHFAGDAGNVGNGDVA